MREPLRHHELLLVWLQLLVLFGAAVGSSRSPGGSATPRSSVTWLRGC